MGNARKISIAIVLCAVLACMLLTAGCSSGLLHTFQYFNEKNQRAEEAAKHGNFTPEDITNMTWTQGKNGTRYLKGDLTNPTGKLIVYYTFSIDFYDFDPGNGGHLLYTFKTTIQNKRQYVVSNYSLSSIEEGGSVHFKIPITDPKIRIAKFNQGYYNVY